MEYGEPTIIDDQVRLDGNGLSAPPVDAGAGWAQHRAQGELFSTVVDE